MAHIIKQYDAIQLRWQFNVSLSDATDVRFLMNSKRRPEPPLVDKTAAVDQVDDTVVVVDLTSNDTATAGRFNVEFEITFSDGQVITFPARGYERLIINTDLGGIVEESS